MERIYFKEIISDRIILRKLEEEDIENFYRYRKNPEVALYQGWDVYTYEEAINFIDSQKNFRPNIPGTWFQIGIALKENRLITEEWKYYNGKTRVSFNPKNMTEKELFEGYMWFRNNFYSFKSIFKRLNKSRTNILHNFIVNVGYKLSIKGTKYKD